MVRGANDILVDAQGRHYIDLLSAYGAALLGHAHPAIASSIAMQLDRLWLAGGFATPGYQEAADALARHFPENYQLAGLYSSGMESAEFALRVARSCSGKNGVAGFENSMHGKSLATASLTWNNHDGLQLPNWHRLPFLPRASEDEILSGLERALQAGSVGAVFVEPIQASGGGYSATPAFYEAVALMTRAHGAMLVWDEILTGFHRTGPAFRFVQLGLAPDVVLFGKACGNGFPVSGVMVDKRVELSRRMLPGSTFAGNPLACTAVSATLGQMAKINMRVLVEAIDATIQRHLGWLQQSRFSLRGQGALWIVEAPAGIDLSPLVEGLFESGICIGYSGRQFRLMPAATIVPDNLERACNTISMMMQRLYR